MQPPAPATNERGHESYQQRARPLIVAGIALVALIGATFAVVDLLFRQLDATATASERPRHELRAEREEPPEPRLQSDPAGDLARQRRAVEARLEGYGWIDRPAGVVRLPLERAQELVLERGLPHFGEAGR